MTRDGQQLQGTTHVGVCNLQARAATVAVATLELQAVRQPLLLVLRGNWAAERRRQPQAVAPRLCVGRLPGPMPSLMRKG